MTGPWRYDRAMRLVQGDQMLFLTKARYGFYLMMIDEGGKTVGMPIRVEDLYNMYDFAKDAEN